MFILQSKLSLHDCESEYLDDDMVLRIGAKPAAWKRLRDRRTAA